MVTEIKLMGEGGGRASFFSLLAHALVRSHGFVPPHAPPTFTHIPTHVHLHTCESEKLVFCLKSGRESIDMTTCSGAHIKVRAKLRGTMLIQPS